MALDKNDIKQIKRIIDEAFTRRTRDFLTKSDAKDFLTKSDAKSFATKDDLKNFATKDDLKNFATKDDLSLFATKGDLALFKDEIEERLKSIPTRDEIFSKLDPILAEIKASREERAIVGNKVSTHEDRIEKLEEIHPQGRHA